MFTTEVLSHKDNKLLTDNSHRPNVLSLRKDKTKASLKNPQTQLNRNNVLISGTHITFRDIISHNFNILSIIWHVARMGEDRGVHRVLVGKPQGKTTLGIPRRRWKDNIKMDLQKVGGSRGDWMEMAQDRDRWRTLVGTVRDFRVP